MLIAKDSVVLIDYVLKDETGSVIDTSEGYEPLAYLHGSETMVPGLERALEGKQAGESLSVTVGPSDGYGERDDELQFGIERSDLAELDGIDEGMQVQLETDDGPMIATIVDIGEDLVVVDGNHPFAGMTLTFDVTIREVREATEEELAHGHVHGPGGHEH